MSRLKSRINRIEGKLCPPEGTVVLTGESREEVEKNYQSYLEKGGNPYSQFIYFIASKIKKKRAFKQRSS